MISNELDVDAWRRHLAHHGRVQILRFLQDDAAERLHHCLREEVPWHQAERGRPNLELGRGDAGHVQLDTATLDAAHGGFHFVYDRHLILESVQRSRQEATLLHDVLYFLNSEPFLQFARYVTGESRLSMVSAQATRYRPGQFLRMHDDRQDDEGRRYAYVMNLSRRWLADWGGLLHFVDAAGSTVESFTPFWNSLSLFRVPSLHHVGLVAPWAQEPRLAVTGWWHVPATVRASTP